MEFLAFDEDLNEVAQALDEAVAGLLLPNSNKIPPQQDPAQDPSPHLVYNSDSELDSDNEPDPDFPWREVQEITSFQLREARGNQQPIENDSFYFQNVTPPPNLLTAMIGMDCEVIELVVFHPVDWIDNGISSWILTTAIDFNPYKDALFGVNQYAQKLKQSLTRCSELFQSNDPRYPLLLNMTMNDINSFLHEITSTQIETLNLINDIHRLKDFRMKRSLLSFGRLFHFLFGTAKDKDVKSMKQDVKGLYGNQISQSKVLNDVISIANISRGMINENILKN